MPTDVTMPVGVVDPRNSWMEELEGDALCKQPPVVKHIILDAWGCERDILDDPNRLRAAVLKAVEVGG